MGNLSLKLALVMQAYEQTDQTSISQGALTGTKAVEEEDAEQRTAEESS